MQSEKILTMEFINQIMIAFVTKGNHDLDTLKHDHENKLVSFFSTTIT